MKKGWIYTTIGESCDINYGTRVVRARDGGSIYDVYGGGGATFKMDTYNREDCVVIARFAMSKVCTRYVKGKFYLNDSGLTITPKEGSPLQQFLLDKLVLALNDTIYECGRGSAQRNLRMDEFKEIKFAYPQEVSEQEKIVSFLDAEFAKINALKANAEQQLQAAQDLFQSALKEYLAPKEGWEKKTMTEIIDRGTNISYGIVQPGEGCQNGIPVVRPVDLRSKYIDSLEGLKKTTPEISNSYTRSILNGKEILMCVRGTTGVVSLSTDVLIGCNVTRGIVPFKISNDTLRNFVYYSIGAPLSANFIQSKTQGAALKQINIADVKQIPVYLPSLKEQRDIVVILDTLSEKVKALQANYDQTITLCNDLKQSLLKSIFE